MNGGTDKTSDTINTIFILQTQTSTLEQPVTYADGTEPTLHILAELIVAQSLEEFYPHAVSQLVCTKIKFALIKKA